MRNLHWAAGRAVALLAAASALLAPSIASAQLTGTRIGKNAEVKDVAKLTQLMAECLAERRSKMVQTWLNELPGTKAESDYIQRQEGDMSICVQDDKLVFAGDREMVYTPSSLRYPIALAYARKRLREVQAVPAGLNPDGAPWFMQPFAALPAGTEVDTVALALQGFGHCVASSDWLGSRALVLSDPASAQEKTAVRVLAPKLAPCLQQDAKITLTPGNLRVALAEPMIHILAGAGK